MPDQNQKNNKPPEPPKLRLPRTALLWVLVALLTVLFFQFGSNVGLTGTKPVRYDIILDYLKQNPQDPKIEEMIIGNTRVTLKFKKGGESEKIYADLPLDGEQPQKKLADLAEANDVPYRFKPESQWLGQLAIYMMPLLIVFGLLYFFFYRPMKQAGGAGGVLSFGKSRARLTTKEHINITFADVAGIDEAREEVEEIIDFLKHPKKFQRLGARIPRGVLLIGPPGSGKTLLAKAIAGEADVPFYTMSGSDFVEMFVGVGASRVRDLFQKAKQNAPCIIFLDEIDAVGRRRGQGWGGGHDEREQTLNAILVEMDGFETDEKVILIAATNRPDVLDHALLRPGRFDRSINIDLPDVLGRQAILKVHARKVKLDSHVDLNELARGTPMFSGADLEAIINEAAILAALKDKQSVMQDDLMEARDKIRWGREKRSRVMDEEDKRITACHEAGHALLAKLLPEVPPLHRVTIIPRGQALGATLQLPTKDRYQIQRKNVHGTVMMLFGGRISEEMFCNDISSGAQSDIKEATSLVRKMVREWGMSERLGPISYADSEEKLYGGEVLLSKAYSEATAVEIDKEVKRIITECYDRAKGLLNEHRHDLEVITEALLKHEALDADDVDDLLAGRPVTKKPVPESRPADENVGDENAGDETFEELRTGIGIADGVGEDRVGLGDEDLAPGGNRLAKDVDDAGEDGGKGNRWDTEGDERTPGQPFPRWRATLDCIAQAGGA